VTVLKEKFTASHAEAWQPSAREKADALYTKIFLSARAAGKLAENGSLDGVEFITFAMTNTEELLGAAGLSANSGDHTWAGVRICRTIAILLQSAYTPEAELTSKQAEVIAPILKPNAEGGTSILQHEYVKLINHLTARDVPVEALNFSKDPEDAFEITVPSALASEDRAAFLSWCESPWGEERTGRSSGGKRNKTKKKAKGEAKSAEPSSASKA
jgi:hypothetical protein